MNRLEHLLWNVAEECAEVAQRASKAARFGMSEVQPGQEFTNAERLIHEYADLIGTMEMLFDEGHIVHGDDFFTLINKKKERFEKFLKLSKEQGTFDV